MQQITAIVTMALPYVVVLAALWFIMIRPQQKREKETKAMRSNVQDGDEILTIGGIYGKVVSQKEDVLTIEVGADKVKLKIARWAIGKIEDKK
ncbi:MAG: preprotein translocase subunit YajC [Clostridia bacterium]|jgi:preprotein translocase subunit YajC|nr:preprotein translocase subunit YajC [Clostridia bacterium]